MTQSTLRMMNTQARMLVTATEVQRVWRGKVARKLVRTIRQERTARVRHAIFIQTMWRGHHTRSELLSEQHDSWYL